MNSSQLRSKLIKDAEWVIEKYIETAKDKSVENEPQARKAQKDIWDAVIPMLQTTGDIQRIRAASTGDIFNMLKRGKVTIAEAERLMNMAHKEFEMTQLPEMLDKFESLQNK